MTSAIQLGDIIQLRKGKKATEVHDQRVNGAMPYIQIDEVRGAAPQKFAYDTKGVIVTPADLCIVWDGANAGTVGYGVDGLIGSTVARMRIKSPDEWDTEFVGRLLQSRFRQLNDEAQARGATIPHVDKSKLEAIEIPRIDRSEQQRIAAILAKSDAIRRKRERAILMIDRLLRATFLEMFGDPVLNTKQMPTAALGDIIKVSSGNGLTAKNMDPSGAYPVYGGNGINGFHSDYMFDEPQLIIGRVGAYCGAIHVSEPKSWVTDNALYVREYKRRINQTYLEWALRFANLNQYAGRAAQPLISGSRIYPIEIVLPSDEKQGVFSDFVSRQRTLHVKLSGARDEAEALFESLSQRAFRGEL